jgi:glycine cleavage system H protein
LSPDDRKYTREHEWILIEDAASKRALVGITDYAQEELGDIVYFELPKVGNTVSRMGKMGEVESVKAVSDLFSPVEGEVIEVNPELAQHPELVNEDPFGVGWLVRVTLANVDEVNGLMSASEYDAYTAGLS